MSTLLNDSVCGTCVWIQTIGIGSQIAQQLTYHSFGFHNTYYAIEEWDSLWCIINSNKALFAIPTKQYIEVYLVIYNNANTEQI